MKKSPDCYNLHAGNCSAVSLTGCTGALPCAPGIVGEGGREVVDGMMGPDWLGLTEGSDITQRRGPVV